MYDDMHDAMLEQIKNLQLETERLKSINNRLCDNLNNLHKSYNEQEIEFFRFYRRAKPEELKNYFHLLRNEK